MPEKSLISSCSLPTWVCGRRGVKKTCTFLVGMRPELTTPTEDIKCFGTTILEYLSRYEIPFSGQGVYDQDRIMGDTRYTCNFRSYCRSQGARDLGSLCHRSVQARGCVLLPYESAGPSQRARRTRFITSSRGKDAWTFTTLMDLGRILREKSKLLLGDRIG